MLNHNRIEVSGGSSKLETIGVRFHGFYIREITASEYRGKTCFCIYLQITMSLLSLY